MVLISGCEQQNHDDTLQSKKAEVPPGVIRIPLDGNVGTLDPGLVSEVTQSELVEQLFLSLTDFEMAPKSADQKTGTDSQLALYEMESDNETVPYQVVPELATDWQVSEDGTVYIFNLRHDVKWTDGKPVTAHDIVWTIQRNLVENENAQFYLIKNYDAIVQGEMERSSLGVRAIDDYTVEFTLEFAEAYFPAMVSGEVYWPLPRHIIEKYGKQWTEPQHIQTNGSYRLTEWDKGNKIILTKNPDYYEAAQVNIQEVRYYVIPESSIGLAMYENNELDIMGGEVYLKLPQVEIPRIQTNPILSKDIRVVQQACTEWYGFNTQRAPTDNLLVRKAISAAVDKQILIDVVIKGSHFLATTLAHPLSFGSVNSKEEQVGIPFNPEQAKKWLAEAGYPDGKNFPKLVLMHNTSETHGEIAKGIKTLLKHYLNIDIEIQDIDWNRYNDAVIPLQPATSPHLFRYSVCVDYPDAINWLGAFHSSTGFNWLSGKNSELFDKMIDDGQFGGEAQRRKKFNNRAEQILTEEEVAIIPLYFNNAQFLVKPRVKDWYHIAFGGQHINKWSLKD